jgi:hypothetical protein
MDFMKQTFGSKKRGDFNIFQQRPSKTAVVLDPKIPVLPAYRDLPTGRVLIVNF